MGKIDNFFDQDICQNFNFNNCSFYEAIFLDNSEITALFNQIRSVVPFEKLSCPFHVTTEFCPQKSHPEFYGEEVLVHIVSYKSGKVLDDYGKYTENEGFGVTLSTKNKAFQQYLDTLNKNFHITGSYQDEAKYTEKINFTDGIPLDFFVVGKFARLGIYT